MFLTENGARAALSSLASLAFLTSLPLFLGCAPAGGNDDAEGAVSDESLSTTNPGAKALVAAAIDHAPPEFLRCSTAPGVRPKLELSVHTLYRTGAATVVLRRFSGSPREAILEGTLEGIPRAGDLQGSVSFKLGNEEVAFDYFAEGEDDPNEMKFRGETIPLRCNVR